MMTADKKTTPAELQLDEGQNGNQLDADTKMKTTTIVPGGPGAALDWAECNACYTVRTVSVNWYGSQLKCARCRELTHHRIRYVSDMERHCGYYLGQLLKAADGILITDEFRTASGENGLFSIDAHLTGAHPAFTVLIASNVTPWGLLRALKHANKWLADADMWSPWSTYGWSTEKDGRLYRGWAMSGKPSDFDDTPGKSDFFDRVMLRD